jgi:hypothetical protein
MTVRNGRRIGFLPGCQARTTRHHQPPGRHPGQNVQQIRARTFSRYGHPRELIRLELCR